jgi:arylsulfatase A-like enzyme
MEKSVRNYFSAYSHSDYHLGRVWDALKKSKHAANTLVIFFSDHGFHLGNLDRFMKSTLWEQVASIPLIIHDPRRKDAQSIIDPVGLIDIGPTVMDMLDLQPIDGTLGQSLTGLMNGNRNPERAIPTFFYDDVAIRKGRYRLIRYRDGSTQMYDLENDYWQVRNLGTDHPYFPQMFSALQETSTSYGFKF